MAYYYGGGGWQGDSGWYGDGGGGGYYGGGGDGGYYGGGGWYSIGGYYGSTYQPGGYTYSNGYLGASGGYVGSYEGYTAYGGYAGTPDTSIDHDEDLSDKGNGENSTAPTVCKSVSAVSSAGLLQEFRNIGAEIKSGVSGDREGGMSFANTPGDFSSSTLCAGPVPDAGDPAGIKLPSLGMDEHSHLSDGANGYPLASDKDMAALRSNLAVDGRSMMAIVGPTGTMTLYGTAAGMAEAGLPFNSLPVVGHTNDGHNIYSAHTTATGY